MIKNTKEVLEKEYINSFNFFNFEYEIINNLSDAKYMYDRFKIEEKTNKFKTAIIELSGVLEDTISILMEDENLETDNDIYNWKKSNLEKINKIDPVEFLNNGYPNVNFNDFMGEELDLDPITNITLISNDSTLIMAKVPVEYSYQLPIYIPMGGFNDCPSPVEQAAIFKYWYDLYGAEPYFVSYDVWELFLKTPITDMSTCIDIAKQQYMFCTDIIEQSMYPTIKGLASQLINSNIWYFWWD